MTNDAGKIIVYSAPCSDGTYALQDGTPKQLEISKMTLKIRASTPKEMKKKTDIANKAVDVLKALFDIGKAFLDNTKKGQKELKEHLEIIAAMGDILKGILKILPGPPNPVVLKLKELEKKIGKLGERMSANFAEMKSYMAEINFFVKVISPTSNLIKYMGDCLAHPGTESRKAFEAAYRKSSPLVMAYTVISYLEKEVTNPLRMAMNAEAVKTTATFMKWEQIFSDVFLQFLILEAFASGLLGTKSDFNLSLLIDRSYQIFEVMSDWKEEYKKDEGYWEDMKVYMGDWLNKNKTLTNAEKADHLKDKLDGYLTNDAFYISVFHHYNTHTHTHFWKNISADKSQFIDCYGYGGGNAFVYRSKQANIVELDKLNEMRDKLQSLKTGDLNDKIIQELKKNPISNAGFTIVFGGLDEAIRNANCPRREWGPGWYTYCFDFGGPVQRRIFCGYL